MLTEKDPEEGKVLIMLKAGDPVAMRIIFSRHGPKLFSLINRIVHDSDTSKDLLQDVFYKLWEKREELKITSLGPYLARAAINEGLIYLRGNPLRRGSAILLSSENIGYLQSHYAEGVEYKELQAMIDKAIASMPPQRKAVFTLSRFEQMSYAQIASHLNISEKSVEKHISKALSSLRIALKSYLKLMLLFMVE